MVSGDKIVAEIVSERSRLASLEQSDDGDPVVKRIYSGVSLPLVSVEVLAYNQGWSLRRCVESIVAQRTTFAFEIIIGNDCSTDNTQEVAEALQKKYPDKITIVTTRRNVGCNRNARNVRKLMRGKFVAFCEGDDWWAVPDKLQKQVQQMDGDSEIALLHGLARFYHEDTGEFRDAKIRFRKKSPSFEWVFDETYRIETAGVMCRHRDLMRIYDEYADAVSARYVMCDTQLFCLLASFGKVKCEDRIVSVRSLSGHSLSQNSDVMRSMKYHDNAFSMKIMLCDLFHVGLRTRLRCVNCYLSSALGILSRCLPYHEAVRVAQKLYPEYHHRLVLMRLFPCPRGKIMRKVYHHFIFRTVRFRMMFGLKCQTETIQWGNQLT